MTTEVKDELSRLVVKSVSARRAEVTSLLRFAGGLHIVGGRVVVEAEVDLGNVARRLRKDIFELYGYNAVVHVLSASGIRKSTRYVLRVANDGEALARQTGLLDNRGRPVRGLPAQVVGGSIADAEAAWRGAFLAHGSLTEPGRSGARRRPGGGARRRGDRRAADADGRPGHPAHLGGAPERRQPAPRRWRQRPGTIWPRPASCASSTGRPRWRSWAASPTRR